MIEGGLISKAMMSLFNKTFVRISFEDLIIQLKEALEKEGFVVTGILDFQQDLQENLGGHVKKYKILNVHMPYLSQQMLTFALHDGVVLPCSITVIEVHPGEVEIIPANPTALIARNLSDASLQNLAEEVTRRMDVVIQSLERSPMNTPDLYTSWS